MSHPHVQPPLPPTTSTASNKDSASPAVCLLSARTIAVRFYFAEPHAEFRHPERRPLLCFAAFDLPGLHILHLLAPSHEPSALSPLPSASNDAPDSGVPPVDLTSQQTHTSSSVSASASASECAGCGGGAGAACCGVCPLGAHWVTAACLRAHLKAEGLSPADLTVRYFRADAHSHDWRTLPSLPDAPVPILCPARPLYLRLERRTATAAPDQSQSQPPDPLHSHVHVCAPTVLPLPDPLHSHVQVCAPTVLPLPSSSPVSAASALQVSAIASVPATATATCDSAPTDVQLEASVARVAERIMLRVMDLIQHTALSHSNHSRAHPHPQPQPHDHHALHSRRHMHGFGYSDSHCSLSSHSSSDGDGEGVHRSITGGQRHRLRQRALRNVNYRHGHGQRDRDGQHLEEAEAEAEAGEDADVEMDADVSEAEAEAEADNLGTEHAAADREYESRLSAHTPPTHVTAAVAAHDHVRDALLISRSHSHDSVETGGAPEMSAASHPQSQPQPQPQSQSQPHSQFQSPSGAAPLRPRPHVVRRSPGSVSAAQSHTHPHSHSNAHTHGRGPTGGPTHPHSHSNALAHGAVVSQRAGLDVALVFASPLVRERDPFHAFFTCAEEVRTILACFERTPLRVEVDVASWASVSRVFSRGARALHVSCHGGYNRDNTFFLAFENEKQLGQQLAIGQLDPFDNNRLVDIIKVTDRTGPPFELGTHSFLFFFVFVPSSSSYFFFFLFRSSVFTRFFLCSFVQPVLAF